MVFLYIRSRLSGDEYTRESTNKLAGAKYTPR
jgi:hypothetical protein